MKEKNIGLGALLEELGFSANEVLNTVKAVLFAPHLKTSEAIAYLWKKRGRQRISLREYVKTDILLEKMINEFKKELAEEYSARAISFAIEKLTKIQSRISQPRRKSYIV